MPCLVHKKWREPLMPRIPKGMAPQFVAGSPKSEVGTTETRTATKAFTSTALFNGTYAIDVLRLHEKEGVARTQDINVLFPCKCHVIGRRIILIMADHSAWNRPPYAPDGRQHPHYRKVTYFHRYE